MQDKPTVVFLLGGPGSGKGTQAELITYSFKFKHLSAGDLLREERKTVGSQYGTVIEECIVNGKIVPSKITVMLLEKAMIKSGFEGGRFLIDGFPRNIQNSQGWEEILKDKVTVPFILNLQCSEKVMEERLLNRGKTSGRSDDNLESIHKRFETFRKQTAQVLEHYKDKVKNINSETDSEHAFAQIAEIFAQHGLM